MYQLVDHKGQLCVAMTDNDYDQPIKRTLFYPIGVKARDYPHYIGEQLRPLGDGLYTLYNQCDTIKFRLLDYGNTLPIDTYGEPIPCPTTRVETRYVRGHWEKYLKSNGWVAG